MEMARPSVCHPDGTESETADGVSRSPVRSGVRTPLQATPVASSRTTGRRPYMRGPPRSVGRVPDAGAREPQPTFAARTRGPYTRVVRALPRGAVAALTLRPVETVLAPYLRHPGAVAFGVLRSLARQTLLSDALVMVALARCGHWSDVRTMRPRTDSRVIAAWRSRLALRGPQQALAAQGKANEAARTQQEFEAAWTRANTWLPVARVRSGAR